MLNRSTRVQRVESEILQILSHHLQHMPPLPCYASITAVEANPDLRHARVYFRLVGQGEPVEVAQSLLTAERSKFQHQVAKQLKTKFCPVLKFEFGVAPAGDEIDNLLENMRRPKRMFED